MKQYEYKSVLIKELAIPHYLELSEEKLNELGKEGWQLVTVHSGHCIFKREVRMVQLKKL